MKAAYSAALLALASGCIDAAQEEVSVPLLLAGHSEAAAFESGRGFAVTLDAAELAFGPLYLCPGATAGELCESALVEWTDAGLVDLLSDKPKRVGELRGLTGRARSYMFDLGFSSLLTRDRPLVLDAARKLAGHSLRISGSVDVQGIKIPFRAALAVQREEQTEKGTPVVRSGQGEDLAHDLAAGDALTVRFDPRQWFRTANFALWVEERSCEPEGPAIVCDAQTELTCDAEGAVTRSRACAGLGQVCIAASGCRDEVVIEANTQVGSAIRIDLTSASSPEFRWSR